MAAWTMRRCRKVLSGSRAPLDCGIGPIVSPQGSRDRTQREAKQFLCHVAWEFRGIASLPFEEGQDALEPCGGIVEAPRAIAALPELPVPTDQCPEFVAEFVARSCGEGAHGRVEADPQTDRPEATGQPEHIGHPAKLFQDGLSIRPRHESVTERRHHLVNVGARLFQAFDGEPLEGLVGPVSIGEYQQVKWSRAVVEGDPRMQIRVAEIVRQPPHHAGLIREGVQTEQGRDVQPAVLGGRAVPTEGRTRDKSEVADGERLQVPVVPPVGSEDADSSGKPAGHHRVADIGEGVRRPPGEAVPTARPRTDVEPEPGIREEASVLGEGMIGLVAPLECDGVLGKFADERGPIPDHIGPKLHDPPPSGHQPVDLLQKLEIDPLDPSFRTGGGGTPPSKIEGLVEAHIELAAAEVRQQLIVEIREKHEAAGVNGAEAVGLWARAEGMDKALGTFGQATVRFVNQPPVHVAEGSTRSNNVSIVGTLSRLTSSSTPRWVKSGQSAMWHPGSLIGSFGVRGAWRGISWISGQM